MKNTLIVILILIATPILLVVVSLVWGMGTFRGYRQESILGTEIEVTPTNKPLLWRIR